MKMKRRRIIVTAILAPLLVACVYREIVVINGTGSGMYSIDDHAMIEANPPAPGYSFYRWTGDTDKVADIRSAKTSIHIYSPGKSTVTATYMPSASLFYATVESGDGSGAYVVGEQVQVFAAPPGPGQYFLGWQGDVSVLANPSQSLQTFKMPAYDVTLKAVYGS